MSLINQLERISFMILIFFPTIIKASCIGIGCSCSASANTINFGNYDPATAGDQLNMGNVAVTCSALLAGLNVSYVITLSDGNGLSGYTPRQMLNGGNTLNYNLYTNSGRTNIWGDGVTSGTDSVSDAYLLSLLSATRNYTVFAKIFAGQPVPTGSYIDSVTATVTY